MNRTPTLRSWLTGVLTASIAVAAWSPTARAAAAAFVAVDADRNVQTSIVLFRDADAAAGFDWADMTQPRVPAGSASARLRDAVLFLQDGVRRMTGRTLDVRSDSDVSRGIVLTLLAHAPVEIRNDPRVQTALRNDGSDSYNDREAFYLRSEKERLLIVANAADGLIAAVPALLETVGYEVLAMGPNWIHVPTDRRTLVFDVERADRPSFYQRRLTPTSGQSYGVGTIKADPKQPLVDPRDEPVDVSYPRWAIAIRDHGRSMPPFPGHALYPYHKPMIAEMLRTGSTEGFLTAGTHLGPDADRPAAAEANASRLWINTDPAGAAGHGKAFVSDGKTWKEQPTFGLLVNLDVTSETARRIVFARMQERAEAHFATEPDEQFVFGTEAEDGGGYARIGEWTAEKNRDWYPAYRRSVGAAWPRPYDLHGYRGIDQPQERWDPATPADAVFAFNNWLLSEFDRWIDSLPADRRVTKSGRSKKELVRTSLYSYAYHDVPPHFNLDPRIRVMIAGYPKHRGLGEWKKFATQHDLASAFRKLLPREPSGEYRIPSIAFYADHTLDGIPARWSASPARILDDLRVTHDAGIRALNYETDFNFGKYGLAYYLMSKALWNVRLTQAELTAIRERWLQRAFGSGWREMRDYYDFLLVENYPANAPAAWAKAIRLIDAADARVDPATEPDAQRRIDDVKQHWYFYYLMDVGAMQAKSPEYVEYLWKGQMSYQTAMQMAVRRTLGPENARLSNSLPEELRRGPAHYSPEETGRWWGRMREHWPLVETAQFADATLADGRRGRVVDLNDLVRVADFQALTAGKPFVFNSAQAPPTQFLTVAKAGETIGFRFAWPANDDQLRFYGPKDVPYGIERWDAAAREWSAVVDAAAALASSRRMDCAHDGRERHVAEVRHVAAAAGTYRVEVGRGGFLATLSSLGYDVSAGTFASRPAHTYVSRLTGLTQDPTFVYVPKGTKSLDLEVWDHYGKKTLTLHRGVGPKGLIPSRDVDVSRRGTHRVALEPGEDGSLARFGGNGFAFPLLYSIPSCWAKCPAELVVPRAVAEADGLRIVE